MERIIKLIFLKFFIRENISLLFFLMLSALIVLNGCKEEGEFFADEVTLNITVYDDSTVVVNGANIYIFNTQNSYENFLVSRDPSFVKDSALSSFTGVALKLEGGIEHWIIIDYFDPVRNLMLGNTGSNKIDKLEKSSVVDADMFVRPVSGNVTFWTTNANKLPINITFNNVSQPALNASLATAPTGPGSPNVVNVSMPAGVYNYYAIGGNDCVWAGTVTVNNGGFYPIELNPCIRGRVSFIAPSYSSVHGPINIKLDNNDNIGTINGPGNYVCGPGSEPGTTAAGSFVTVTRDFNTYNYIARTQDGACVWTGTFTISGDGCITISLPLCP